MVKNKHHQQWLWVAFDAYTRETIGLHVGDRSQHRARALWNSLPPVYRQGAVFYPDFLEAYRGVWPKKRHRPVSKKTGKTRLIERGNATLRQPIASLVRKSLSFSKNLSNPIGALWYFVHHDHQKILESISP